MDNVLNATDRCDRCGAAAYVRGRTASGLLLDFCMHHSKKHMPQFIEQGGEVVVDNTESLYKVASMV